MLPDAQESNRIG